MSDLKPVDQKDTPEPTPAVTPTTETPPPAWTSTYDTVQSKLPTFVSTRLPSSTTAAATVSQVSSQLSTLGTSSKEHLSTLNASGKELKRAGSKRFVDLSESLKQRKLTPEALTANAWSVTNQTQVSLNISLNQVGPLMYQVVLPNETFERRVPNLWFTLSLRPWTSKKSETNSWDCTWPILAVAGPSVAAASLLAIPLVAIAAGGTALASLTAFGSSVGSAVVSTGSAVASSGSAAVGLAARAAALPGGAKVKGKLVDAAKSNFGSRGEVLLPKVVRYFAKGTATAAAGGVLEAAGGKKVEEGGKVKERKKGKKIDEVEVTGYELEKVLRCETGKSKVDKALTAAFERLSFKSRDFKTSLNPVLAVVGGPEIEERGKHTYLVFYPFALEEIVDVEVEPLSTTELPPTADETSFLRDARLVPSVKEAEAAAAKAPAHGDDAYASDKGKEGGEVDEAVESVVKHEVESGAKVDGGEGEKAKKKGWFW